MRHFLKIGTDIKETGRGANKREILSLKPVFMSSGKDIMKKGGLFYAFLDKDSGMWVTDQQELYSAIDKELYAYADEHFAKDRFGHYHDEQNREVHILDIDNSTTGMLITFNKWFNNLPPNHNYKPLDSDLTFLSDEVTPEMYRSKRLPYDIKEGPIDAYESIISTLYAEDSRRMIEWSIGAVLSGDSKTIEKMVVLYGKKGTGKSTVLDLIQKIFEGYWAGFVAEDLASKANQFATAAFKDNPLVAIQDDGSLAKIDSPRINEIVSHKITQINEKNTKQYNLRVKAMLFLATNELVDIHDTNLGIARRILDVYPTNKLLPVREYRKSVNQMMKFEIPAIAYHCLEVYKSLGKEYYTKYEPASMIQKTNYLRNFIFDYADKLVKEDPIQRDTVYKWYMSYFEESGLGYPPKRLIFGEQLKEYYETYEEMKWCNGHSARHVYSGFKKDQFLIDGKENIFEPEPEKSWIEFKEQVSTFDIWCKDKGFKAQYATKDETPKKAWDKVTTTMEDIDSRKLHYVLVPEEESVIFADFDIRDENGNKSFERNLEEASKWPKTYAELSKSGGGIHLYYFWDGDINTLESDYAPGVEIKVCKGKSAIRRKLTKCNDIPMATLNSGLPQKKERRKDVIDTYAIKDQRHLENKVASALLKKGKLNKTILACNYIYKVVEEEAYQGGMSYDIRHMEQDIRQFANNSHNNKEYCTKLMAKIHLCSDDMLGDATKVGVPDDSEKPIAFFDVEVFPNVFIVCWKLAGDTTTIRMINPDTTELAKVIKNYRLIGFNNRRYDNHMLYAWCVKGYSNYEMFKLSSSIINSKKGEGTNKFFGPAYNLSYLDLYDLASNPHKMSLKKWEIKLHAHHQENAYAWDQDLPEDKWMEVADYCENDVKATELLYNAIYGDVAARLILSEISGLLPNATTNSHSMQFIFGEDQHPQTQFVYTDLSKMFPGYKYENGVSTYRGEVVGEGGYVYSEPGLYFHVALLDVASMHPSSIEALNLFGDIYTKRFSEIKNARIAIKHKDREALKTLLDGLLLKFYDIGLEGKEYTLKDLANALKTVINSVYGLTFASFSNRCRDERNIDNIVAKRGALFMVNLKHEVQDRGYKVVHIKTDSIKIANADEEIIKFVMDYGKMFGYTFEHEATYEKMCLVNDAVYIAKYEDGDHEFELSTGEKIMTPWTATGKEFQVPYVFKTLFSKTEVNIDDLSETIAVSAGELYLDFNEQLNEDEHNYQFIGKVSAFLPVKDGTNGGLLYRMQNDKYYAAAGTKGYRWLETESVRLSNKEDCIDMAYYEKMANDAIAHINEFGNYNMFISDDPYKEMSEFINVPIDSDEEVPFDEDKVLTVA